ncbi:phenoloxidase 1-like [Tribolium madens]|uniref:phenoloxidase 1-like n=1 Tax=Tribolium madens TaxID=41895 RepID=UPI001CF75BA0|nr:phenoloxidase 1-like [Tribolium madens]
MTDKSKLLLLFDRPQEPSFMPKGNKEVFDVPNNFLPERYKPIGVQIANRFGEQANEKIPLKNITPPDLEGVLDLGRHENFSLFVPKHRKVAGKLIRIFLAAESIDDLLSNAVFCRDRVNPYLFYYAFSVALLHRPDTQNLDLPSFIHVFPDKYVDSQVFARAREEAHIVPEGSRTPIEIPQDFTASDLDEEHRVAYWREDIGLNLHHWHWHLVYPFEGAREIVDKNRRGEIFYYMHQQIIARFNIERLCNGLKRVVKLSNWREPLPEAYFPKLDSLVSSRTWPARPVNQLPRDLNREVDQIRLSLDDLDRWRDRIYDAIHSGMVRGENGQNIPLTEFEGIDVLGNIIESSILSPNRNYYGDFHNMGHILIGYIHDPDHRFLEPFGVMADPAVDLRDPLFFRWHAYIDDMFQEFKATLPRYTVAQLNYPGVTVNSIEVQAKGGRPNILSTFWQQSDLDLSRGLDFQPRGSVFVRFTHLQNQDFTYKITVNNSGNNRMGTCRIFLAPKFDERGNPWLFRNQKDMFIELDRFAVSLKQGANTITRHSTESSLTIPFERTFRNLDVNRPTGGDALSQFNFCGCGWPQHMLLPKGTEAGYLCQLFVMISNYADDRVEQDTSGTCNDGDTFCGIKDKLYPDRRSMGYPFDRMPRDGVDTLQQFLTPNMRVQDVVIQFSNRVVKPRSRD